jgi:group II intron reverse transcriptase/maturase
VRSNGGAAGIDGETIQAIEERGAEEFVLEIQAALRAGRYRPSPVKRRWIPKADGKQRPLGIPTVRDRVVQMAAKIVIEPIFEADFQPFSYGFRPKKRAVDALEAIRVAGNRGYNFVVDADIQGYFDNIQRDTLMELVKERISDRRVLKLIRQWLDAGVMEDGTVRETLAGTPQGGVISPLLANIYLNKLDRIWAAQCGQLGIMVRFADDFVAMCRTESAAREALRRIGLVMERLGLTLHPAKTRLVDLRRGRESFVFLGCTIRKKRSIQRAPDKHFVQRWPSPKATKKLRDRVREITGKRHSGKDVKQIIAELTPVLRGWGNYFRSGNADREFNKMDYFVVRSLRRWQFRRGGQRPTKRAPFTGDQLYGMGLHRLMGTVKYPAQATPRRSSLSRVPENGMHGLKGEIRNGLA